MKIRFRLERQQGHSLPEGHDDLRPSRAQRLRHTELPGGAALLGVHLSFGAKPATFTMVEGRISHYKEDAECPVALRYC